MKIHEVYGTPKYNQWIREVRKFFPNATITGSKHQAQMVDWTSVNNEVAGDWDGTNGVVYEPGSKGSKIVKTVE